ncbi:hypothetical protein K2Q00_01200 [Patescibacteria group bacterium]|nr:hypothetical protein [Patescibacteria group bacterium]
MKPTKLKSRIYLGIASGIVFIWVGFLIFGLMFAFLQTPDKKDSLTYTSQEVGLEFLYPKTYTLTVRHDSYASAEIHVLTLINASTTVPDMSEGPTAISVIEIPVSGSPDLEQWVRNATISNFNLSPDKTFTPKNIDGEDGVAYRFSGLYESDAVAVEHDGKIFLFAVSWMDQNDPMRHDFQELLDSVEFK